MRNRWRDLLFGLRLLWKNPGFTAVAVLALALGIGANTAIFSVVYATLLAPLPYNQPDRIVMVWSKINGQRNVTAAGVFVDWQRQNTTFDSMAAFTGGQMSLTTAAQPEQVEAEPSSPGFLHILGQPILLGRDFLPEEGQIGKDLEVILTYRLWQNRFGGDRNIVGQQIRLNAQQYTVVGVLAPGATDRVQSELYIPLAFKPEQLNHEFHWLLVMARLKPGVTIAQANADMDSVTKHIAAVYYLLGEEFDRDPFLIFRMRGMSREAFLGLLGSGRTGLVAAAPILAPEPLPADPAEFWKPSRQLASESACPTMAAVKEAALPRRLGKFPFWRGRLNFHEFLDGVYARASTHAADVLTADRTSRVQV